MKRKRIRFLGGNYGSITLSLPEQFTPTKASNIAWQIEDVTIDGVNIATRRSPVCCCTATSVAVLRSYVHATEYSVFSTRFRRPEHDFIIAGNVFASEGVQATLRLIGIHNAVVVDNHLTDLENTGQKHNYRVHGVSDHVFGARNILVGAGVMMARCPRRARRHLVHDSTMYHRHAGPV